MIMQKSSRSTTRLTDQQLAALTALLAGRRAVLRAEGGGTKSLAAAAKVRWANVCVDGVVFGLKTFRRLKTLKLIDEDLEPTRTARRIYGQRSTPMVNAGGEHCRKTVVPFIAGAQERRQDSGFAQAAD